MAEQLGHEKERSCCGYECEFVDAPPDYLQTECSICLLVLRSPHITSCCGHNFCRECIERVKKAGKKCPLCNAHKFSLAYNRAHDGSLKQFEVYCIHHKMGCEWTGKLEMLDEHLNLDPWLDKQLDGCAFVEVRCCNDGCNHFLLRRLIAEHQHKVCLRRPFNCEHCHEFDSTYYDVTTEHLLVCPRYPVPCPNSCKGNTFERQLLEKHLNEDCPLQVVECEFKYAGCEIKLPRKGMAEHMKESVHHVSLLAWQNHQLVMKLLEKEETIEQKLREVGECRREVNDCQREMERIGREKDEQIGQLKEHLMRLEARFEADQDETTKALEELHHHIQIAPVQLVVKNFGQFRRNWRVWYSEEFYSHPQGYKMSLCVNPNGDGSGQGTHVSCFIYLMKGEFDNHLNWPFRGKVTIELLNQRGDHDHYAHTVYFDGRTPAAMRVTGGKASSEGWGTPQFIAHDELGQAPAGANRQYLMNNTLYFRVSIELLDQ